MVSGLVRTWLMRSGAFGLVLLGAGGAVALAAKVGLDPRILGAWTINETDCATTFEKAAGKIRLRKGQLALGSSFVVTPSRIVSPIQSCSAAGVRTTSDTTSFHLTCWNSVSLDEQDVRIKVIGPDEIEYQFPRTPELNQRFRRCSM